MADVSTKEADDLPYRIVEEMGLGLTFRSCTCGQLLCARLRPLRDALETVRRDALTEVAGLECVFCAGAPGFNSEPVEVEGGNYVHRNEPPDRQAGVYCQAARIRALIAELAQRTEGKANG